jgi:hypothetical protein
MRGSCVTILERRLVRSLLVAALLSIAATSACQLIGGIHDIVYEDAGDSGRGLHRDAGARDGSKGHDAAADARHERDGPGLADASDGRREASGPDAPTKSCEPGTVRDGGTCEMCGTLQQTCNPSGQWTDAVCQGQSGVCTPGAMQSTPCGNCGTASAMCQSDCTWGAMSACANEGVCAPGTVMCCNFVPPVPPDNCCVGAAACGANASCPTCIANNGGTFWDYYVCASDCTWFDCSAAGCGVSMCGG